MTDETNGTDAPRPARGHSPADDCGHSLEELGEYLETGSSPYAAHFGQCPQCQAGLASLRVLGDLTRRLAEEDTRAAAASDGWLQDILSNLRLETRAGRSIPVASENPDDGLSETEGAVVALIRSAGDAIDGVTIGKCRLHGDITRPGAPTRVELSVTALHGYRLPALVDALRTSVGEVFGLHTELHLDGVDITVADIVQDGQGTTPGPGLEEHP
ncbi:Asp23/Gls24 family envelope stress response protein [Arthrobacter agilis]|uniref:Asp23/Gls24 family envelope stress response protein n=1 Tax=Arthrobacter agilis TaxID=37921 RepID=UPI0023672C27|nr:Asp23/Gls24 family envelope stress response protein [Arthrobacter agilis]WDF34135.1 Asp23/Gls24 family envelope stress response protein [Arthrobacter agilis]